MITADVSQCAACGNKGGDDLKACTACKLVTYCNVTCQKSHRPKHKRECKRRVAELFDEALFQQPPPKEDCPICFLPLPFGPEYTHYKACCGKVLCRGCLCSCAVAAEMTNIPPRCPFCRTPTYTSNEELIERCKKRMERKEAEAFTSLASYYHDGVVGLPLDLKKAIGLLLRAAELGSKEAHYLLGHAYYVGDGVEKDMKKANHYWKCAAMGGHDPSRHSLGVWEAKHSYIRAKKHFMIAARAGYDDSLETIRDWFMAGYVTKEEYEKTLRAHKDSQDEMKSVQRDIAVEAFLKYHSSR